jgi:hypothetical protein
MIRALSPAVRWHREAGKRGGNTIYVVRVLSSVTHCARINVEAFDRVREANARARQHISDLPVSPPPCAIFSREASA